MALCHDWFKETVHPKFYSNVNRNKIFKGYLNYFELHFTCGNVNVRRTELDLWHRTKVRACDINAVECEGNYLLLFKVLFCTNHTSCFSKGILHPTYHDFRFSNESNQEESVWFKNLFDSKIICWYKFCWIKNNLFIQEFVWLKTNLFKVKNKKWICSRKRSK